MQKSLFICLISFLLTFFQGLYLITSGYPGSTKSEGFITYSTSTSRPQTDEERLGMIATKIRNLNTLHDTTGLLQLCDSLIRTISSNKDDPPFLAELYYYLGVCDILAYRYNNSISHLKQCIGLKRSMNIADEHFANALFNTGIAYHRLGDYIQEISFLKEYLGLVVKMFGPNSIEEVEACSALASASIQCLDYDGFVNYSLRALGIVNQNESALPPSKLRDLFGIIGAGYANMGDYAKAKIYLEKTEIVIKKNNIPHDENYINLINSLAVTYGSLGLADKEKEYFDLGIDLAIADPSEMAFNLVNTYAIELGRKGEVRKGASLLSDVVSKARYVYGTDSRLYTMVLNNYAGYIVLFTNEKNDALNIYKSLLHYTEGHGNDVVLNDLILRGYAKVLYETGDAGGALRIIRGQLFDEKGTNISDDLYSNPAIHSITAEKGTLNTVQLKYEILWSLYSESGDFKILEAAAKTSETIISLIEIIRINISEEESRLVLGDNFRDSYLAAIRDFELCYRKTGDRRFLEKAFEFAEKSKVAGLLTATRQLKAVQFHIPQLLAEKEKTLQREISFYNSKIFSENTKENPDKEVLSSFNQNLLSAVAARDSLVVTFENDYPEYFTLKYNGQVPEMKDIPSIIGRNNNYLNYVMSDSLLYIFLVNRKHGELLTFRIDSTLMRNLSDFRKLLSDASQGEAARTKFNNYQQIGHDLYKTLIEPVKKFLITNNLLVSPDNILSYLPFETFLSSKYQGTDILYRKLDYMMNDFNISYAYSATFMKESKRSNYFGRNSLIAFAPAYPASLNIDSLIRERQAGNFLNDLPSARQEAEYVTELTGGKLCINDDAMESFFKSEADNYSIIHLAMHTIVDDVNPMNSAMIFAQVKDSTDDGLLYTYEVYGIPLKARMVVLSSCNTGNGLLSSGEGILSLARGFLYSGSQSVVMSLWKIEDRSGTQIIKLFYDNLEKGMSKSRALKKARYQYLRDASQLRSHPYFWSTLVIFGDNAPVFIPWKVVLPLLGLLVLIAAGLLYYFRLRIKS